MEAVCPQVFSSGGTCTLLPSFLGVHPNFWGCNVPSNSSFGGTKKMNCIFSTQGEHAVFCKYQAKKKIVCLLSHVKKNLGSVGREYFFSLLLAKPEIVVPGSGIRFRYFIFEIFGKTSFVEAFMTSYAVFLPLLSISTKSQWLNK